MNSTQAEAEKVAEFLGFFLDKHAAAFIPWLIPNNDEIKTELRFESGYGEIVYQSDTIDWLTSDSGTVAMQEKLMREYGQIILENNTRFGHNYDVVAMDGSHIGTNPEMIRPQKSIIGCEPTLNDVLIKICLEEIENG